VVATLDPVNGGIHDSRSSTARPQARPTRPGAPAQASAAGGTLDEEITVHPSHLANHQPNGRVGCDTAVLPRPEEVAGATRTAPSARGRDSAGIAIPVEEGACLALPG
jgi:hypothetical protein